MKSTFRLISFFVVASFAFGHGVSEADKVDMVGGGLADYMYLGAKHMVTGYDHILFLIGVLFFLTKFSDIVKFITAFTLGHCITLIGATILEINANYYLIDAVIAISVIYKGFENLDGFKKCLNKNAPNLVIMVFVFGLIHGFGLSTRLQQIALGHENVILKIISFNVGVEIGQIAVLAIIYPVILFLRGDSFGKVSKITNTGLMIAGMGLLCYQLNGYFSSTSVEEHGPIEERGHDHGNEDHHHKRHGHDHHDDHHHDGDHEHELQGQEEHSHDDNRENHDRGKAQDAEFEAEHHDHGNDHSHYHQHGTAHHHQDNGKSYEQENQSQHYDHGDGVSHDHDDENRDHGDHQHDH